MRAEALALPEPKVGPVVVTVEVEVDEMWHFLKKIGQALGLARL